MPDQVRVTLLSNGSQYAGGILQLRDDVRKILFTTYLSLNRDLPGTYHPSYYLWWEAINWAWDHHYEKVSFGVELLGDNNPRYRVKNALGGQYQPKYSALIPLTKIFSLGLRWRQTNFTSPGKNREVGNRARNTASESHDQAYFGAPDR